MAENQDDYEIFDQRSMKPLCRKVDLSQVGSSLKSIVIQEADKIELIDNLKVDKSPFDYFAPNNVRLLISISNNSLANAKLLYDENFNEDTVGVSEKFMDKGAGELVKRSKVIYNYIEMVQTCIVFGYTALEAFTNLSIPDGYEYKTTPNNKGIVEIYDKNALERNASLSLKISKILVEIYKTKSIIQTNLWKDFKEFEVYRHEIIHQKSINDTNFYKKYFRKDLFELCNNPIEIMKFFFKRG